MRTTVLVIAICFLLAVASATVTVWLVKKMNPDSLLVGSENMPHQPARTAQALNTWYSSAYSFPSEPLFAYPGAFKLTEAGLEIGIPQVITTEKLVAAPFIRWCSVRGNEPIIHATVQEYTDWGITIAFETNAGKWHAQITQGSPVVYLSNLTSDLQIICEPSVTIRTNTARAVFSQLGAQGALLIQSQDNQPVQIASQPYNWKLSSKTQQYRISLLPDESTEMIALFFDQPWNPIVSSQISWEVSETVVQTVYDLRTQLNTAPLITLFPHHVTHLEQQLPVLATYPSVLGPLRLVQTSHFSTSLPKPNLQMQFSENENPADWHLIQTAIREDAKQYAFETPPAGVYFKGTWIGALTSLVQLSKLYGVEPEHTQLLNRLESELHGSQSQFSYDTTNRLFSANNPEFGHEQGNDHHFHYGYYLRALAVLVAEKPELLSKYADTAENMLADIAQPIETDRYPKLHYFSPFAGHSWADANGKFADGNNQESTSEALQAWYAVWLWGTVTDQPEIVDLGSWLYAQELSATQSYWYGQDNPFPNGYEHTMASLVWGGKREFATWFSPQPLHIHGIQWLPLTPASAYSLSQLPLKESIAELDVLEDNPVKHEWGDLYVAALASFNTTKAVQLLPNLSGFLGTKSRAVLYGFLLQ